MHIFSRSGSAVGASVLAGMLAAIALGCAPSWAQSAPPEAATANAKKKLPRKPAAVSSAAPASAPAATEPEKGEHSLANDAQNPIANIVTVPFQNNTYFSAGPYHHALNDLLVEPVYPFRINDDWNIVTRTIIPITYQPRFSPDYGPEFGLGNIVPQAYLVPSHPGPIIWGAGAQLFTPTATNKFVDTVAVDKWGGGPAAVALTIQGPWLVGLLANNAWAGSGRVRVNEMTLNPFVFYNFPNAWYLVSSTVITSDWTAPGNNKWTVPIGGGVGRVFKIAGQALNARVQAFYEVERPTYGPRWQVQAQLQFLFPK